MGKHIFIILAYGQSNYLERCIESLEAQTVQSSIIMTTSTPSEWLSAIASCHHIPLIVRQGKPAIADDWNFALTQGNAELVTLIHQDDIYCPDYLSHILKRSETISDMVVAFTDYGEITDHQTRYFNFNLLVKRLMLTPFYLFHHYRKCWIKKAVLAFGNPICCPSVTYNKTRIGAFQFSSDLSINLDWFAWTALAEKKGSFLYVPEKLMLHQIHNQSETSLGLKENRRQKDDLMMFQLFWPKPIAKLLTRLYSMSYKSNND